jgi:LPS export ABC transporter permease LptF
MGRLDRYLFSNAAIAFLAVLGSLTTMVWLTQVLRRFDLLATQGQSLFVFLNVTALALPMLMLVIAPIALFIAILFTLNRLSADSELIVMSAAGVSRWRIFRPLLVLTLIVAPLSMLVSAEVGPWTLRTLREQIARVNADIVSNVAVPGRFLSLEKGLTFHVRERGPNGLMMGIFVHDARNPDNETTYIAERGRIAQNDKAAYLILDQGVMQRRQGSQQGAELRRVSALRLRSVAADAEPERAVSRDRPHALRSHHGGRARRDVQAGSRPLPRRVAQAPLLAAVSDRRLRDRVRVSRTGAHHAPEPRPCVAGAAGAFALVEILGFGTQGFIAKERFANLDILLRAARGHPLRPADHFRHPAIQGAELPPTHRGCRRGTL